MVKQNSKIKNKTVVLEDKHRELQTTDKAVETRTLHISELLVSHRLFETGHLLPEETVPRWEVCSLEQCALQDTFHTTQCSDNIDTIVVELP